VTTHVLFDFFGTLVEYSPSRTDQGYDRSFSLLRDAGLRLGYEADYRGATGAGMSALLIDPFSQAPVPNRDRLTSLFELESRLV